MFDPPLILAVFYKGEAYFSMYRQVLSMFFNGSGVSLSITEAEAIWK